jgi:hypothetical protein
MINVDENNLISKDLLIILGEHCLINEEEDLIDLMEDVLFNAEDGIFSGQGNLINKEGPFKDAKCLISDKDVRYIVDCMQNQGHCAESRWYTTRKNILSNQIPIVMSRLIMMKMSYLSCGDTYGVKF